MQASCFRPRRALVLFALVCASVPEPLRATDLAALLDEVDSRSPELLAARSRAGAASHLAEQASAPLDPLVFLAYTNDGLDEITLGESIDSVLALTWQQDLRYPGTRRLATEVAASEHDAGLAAVERQRLRSHERIKRLYAELYRLDRTLEILLENRQILTVVAETGRVRYEAGQGIQASVLRAMTEIARLDADVEHARRERREVAFGLSAEVGSDAPILPDTETLPDASRSDDELVDLAQRAVADSPELREAEARVRREESALNLARRGVASDLSWSASYQYRGELDPMVGGGIGIRLPLHREQRQYSAIAQVAAELAAARHERERVELWARAEARSLADEARNSGLLARQYREAVLPQAESTVEAARAAYGAGQVELAVLLEDLGRMYAYRIREVTERANRVRAIASLEATLGLPLLDLTTGRGRS